MPEQGRVWMHVPDAGGVKIPPAVRQRTEQRILRYAKKHFTDKYTRLEIRFRSQFCYIDAYTEPSIPKDWPPEEWQETREQYIERLRNTPTHLCRLRYFGDEERWALRVEHVAQRRFLWLAGRRICHRCRTVSGTGIGPRIECGLVESRPPRQRPQASPRIVSESKSPTVFRLSMRHGRATATRERRGSPFTFQTHGCLFIESASSSCVSTCEGSQGL